MLANWKVRSRAIGGKNRSPIMTTFPSIAMAFVP